MKRTLCALLLALALLAGTGTAALAGATTETETLKNFTESFTDELPCVGPAKITITYNAIFHFTGTGKGSHFTGTLTGTFVADPLDASRPTYTGHFTQWFGDNQNPRTSNGSFTFTVVGKGSDGSRIKFHETAHFLATSTGHVIEFDKTNCH